MHIHTVMIMTTEVVRRPPMESVKSGAHLKDWYWLKTEVMNHARMLRLPVTGAKFEIIDRIADHLDGKTIPIPRRASPAHGQATVLIGTARRFPAKRRFAPTIETHKMSGGFLLRPSGGIFRSTLPLWLG